MAAKRWNRKEMYTWLGEQLGWKTKEEIRKNCHVGSFNLETCKKAQDLLRKELQKGTAEALL